MGKSWEQLTDKEQKEKIASKLEDKKLDGKSMIDMPMLGGVWTPQCCDCKKYYIPDNVNEFIICLHFNTPTPQEYSENKRPCPFLEPKENK